MGRNVCRFSQRNTPTLAGAGRLAAQRVPACRRAGRCSGIRRQGARNPSRSNCGEGGKGAGPPPGITPENVLDRQWPRNRRIADIFSKCGLVERADQGMNLMFEQSVRQAKALPDFRGTDDMHVRVTLEGMVQDKNLLVMMEKIGRETLARRGGASGRSSFRRADHAHVRRRSV